jgi:RNA polymerase sigma-70 factor, ECF subfamily
LDDALDQLDGRLQPTDLDLLRRARLGDGKAFHALVDRYAKPLFGLAYSLVGNASDAEDIVQETFAGAFKSIASFEERSSVKTWLSRILMNQVARWRRDTGAKTGTKNPAMRIVPLEAAENVSAGGHRGAAAAVDAKLDLSVVLKKLTDEHREVLVLREIDQLSYDEIAEVLDLPRGTVESRLHRARAELRAKLQEYETGG